MTNPFHDPTKLIAKRTGREAYKDYLDRTKDEEGKTRNRKPQSKSSLLTNPNFSLEDLTDSYRITGVSYRDEIHQVDLSKTLLPQRTQDGHAEHRRKAITDSNEFYLPDYPLFHSIITTLYENKEKQGVEEVRKFIKDSALENWLMMLTRIQYNPEGEIDKIIHNYKQPDEYKIEIDSFAGPDGHITNKETTNIELPLQALLDTKQTIQEINQIYQWLTDVDAYIWRLNSKPDEVREAVAGFVAYSYGVVLDCIGDPQSSNSGLRVRHAKILRSK